MRIRRRTVPHGLEQFIHFKTPESKLATCICTNCMAIFAVADDSELADAQATHDCLETILSRYNGAGRFRTNA